MGGNFLEDIFPGGALFPGAFFLERIYVGFLLKQKKFLNFKRFSLISLKNFEFIQTGLI